MLGTTPAVPPPASIAVVCAWCGRLRDAGAWVEALAGEVFKHERVSHGLCPDCDKVIRKLFTA